MMAAVVSGVLMHRHLIRDLFVAERPGRRLVSARDRHVLAASWSIPFAFVLAFTGSFFSFAGTVGLPLVAADRLRRRPGEDGRDPLRAAGARGRDAGAAREPRLHHRRLRRARAGSPATFVAIAQLRPRRRARPRLARPGATAASSTSPTSTTARAAPSSAATPPLGTAPSAGGDALRADVPAALRPFRRDALQGRLGRARRRDVLRHPLGLPALGEAPRRRAAVARLRPRVAGRRLRPAARDARLGLRLLPVAAGGRSLLLDAGGLRRSGPALAIALGSRAADDRRARRAATGGCSALACLGAAAPAHGDRAAWTGPRRSSPARPTSSPSTSSSSSPGLPAALAARAAASRAAAPAPVPGPAE